MKKFRSLFEKSDPCWKNYEMVGMKDKNGKKVPNCVPVKESIDEQIQMLDEMPGANMDTRAVHQHLKKQGWSLTRSSGGHDVFTHPEAKHHIPVPRHRQLKAPLVRGILKQSKINEAKDEQEYGYEGDMAMNQLETVIRHATYLKDMMKPDTDLPEWVQSKITLATDYLQTACDYMTSEMKESYHDNRRGFGKPPREDDEYHVPDPTVKKTKLKKEEVEQLEEGRPSQRHPLEGHDYHKKTDAELKYIAKDAHAAAEAMKSHNTDAENKYRDQASDSATVRYYRQKNGMQPWYKKKYGHVNEEVVSEDNVINTNSINTVHSQPKKKQTPDVERYVTGQSKQVAGTNVVASPRESVQEGVAMNIAKLAARRNAGIKEANDNTLSSYDKEDTPAKKTLSKTAGMVKDLATNAKTKAKVKKSDDAFQPEPELASNIVR